MKKEPRGRHRQRVGRIAVAAIAFLSVMAAVMLGFVLNWVWNPQVDDIAPVDAIVVLAYGKDRLQEGRRLAESGVSDNLVISISNRMNTQIEDGRLPVLSPEEVAAEDKLSVSSSKAGQGGPWVELCDARYPDYYTWCFHPDPNTTEGEAMAVSDLMTANGWDSIVVVTERSHLNRSLRIFDSCVEGDVSGAISNRSGPWYRGLWRSVYEVGAIAKTATLGACGG